MNQVRGCFSRPRDQSALVDGISYAETATRQRAKVFELASLVAKCMTARIRHVGPAHNLPRFVDAGGLTVTSAERVQIQHPRMAVKKRMRRRQAVYQILTTCCPAH